MSFGSRLSTDELAQRVAVLRRFRELLERQRDKFRSYLEVLNHQKDDIVEGDIDALVSHIDLEQSVVAEIFAVQKVIDPLEDMYRVMRGAEPDGIDELKTTLVALKGEVAVRNEENRLLLKQRMEMLRHEIMSIKNPYAKRKSVYSSESEPSSIDIKG